MSAVFLPKSLDGIGTRKYIVDHQTCRSNTQMHWHDCIEMVYVEKGHMRFFLNNEWHEMVGGDLVFVPPQRVHYMLCDNDETWKTVVGISHSIICDTDADEENVLLPFKTDQINDHCFFKDNGELASIIKRLNSFNDSYVGRLLIQAEILKIYAYVYKEWMSRGLTFIEPIQDKYIVEIIRILESDYLDAPGAGEMAKRLGLSYSHMCRLLSDHLGTNYNSLLNSIRMENAKKMLLTTDKSITEIGLDCGFCDSSYFIKMFKKSIGITPKKYRAIGSC